MPELPSGAVTLLLADVEGSTRHVQELGPDWAGALAAVRRLLRAAVAAAGGVEVDCHGDELMAAFSGRRARLPRLPQPSWR